MKNAFKSVNTNKTVIINTNSKNVKICKTDTILKKVRLRNKWEVKEKLLCCVNSTEEHLHKQSLPKSCTRIKVVNKVINFEINQKCACKSGFCEYYNISKQNVGKLLYEKSIIRDNIKPTYAQILNTHSNKAIHYSNINNKYHCPIHSLTKSSCAKLPGVLTGLSSIVFNKKSSKYLITANISPIYSKLKQDKAWQMIKRNKNWSISDQHKLLLKSSTTTTYNKYEILNNENLEVNETNTPEGTECHIQTPEGTHSMNQTSTHINNRIKIRSRTRWDTSPITKARIIAYRLINKHTTNVLNTPNTTESITMLSPTTKARSTANRINNEHRERSIANRLDNEYKDLTSDYTDKINKSSSRKNTRWDLSPKDKARIIANRLIAEHLTNINSNLSQMTNNSNSLSSATKKKPRPHRGRKHRPKDIIKKLNKKDQLKIGFINTQSALHKVLTIKDYILEHDLDILYIAESWFNEKGDEVNIGNMIPEGYSFKQTPRVETNRRGGIVVIYKKHIQLKKEIQPTVTSMEIMETTINLNTRRIKCITIYRPESSNIHKYNMSTFFSDLENLLTHYILTKDELLIIDDFNFHMNKPDKPNVK